MFENVRNTLKSKSARLRLLAVPRRILRQEDGSAAVEFSFILLPFLMLMFMIIETALVFFAGQTLETAVADSARLILTGQAQTANMNQAAFKTAVCSKIYGLFDCANGIYVDVQSYSSFGSINNTVQYDAQGKPITNYSPGTQGSIVVVRLMYQWPIVVPFLQNYLADPSAKTRMLVATAAFQNEPY